jgi:hypothetical protein
VLLIALPKCLNPPDQYLDGAGEIHRRRASNYSLVITGDTELPGNYSHTGNYCLPTSSRQIVLNPRISAPKPI